MMNKDDFDALSWHDCKVYSITFPTADGHVSIDIDFIIEWVKKEDGAGYKFLVAPAILRFENVSNLFIKIEAANTDEIYISEIERINQRLTPNGKMWMWDFVLILEVGEITFSSTGFEQEITASPKLVEEQTYGRESPSSA